MYKERQIDRISTVLETRGAPGGLQFIGWTPEGEPGSAYSLSGLTEDARKRYEDYRKAGMNIRKVDYRNIIPVEHVVVGQATAFTNVDGSRRYIMGYTVAGDGGEVADLTFSEYSILEAIERSKFPWQEVSSLNRADAAANAAPIYTLIASDRESDKNTAYAIMYQSMPVGTSNAIQFEAAVEAIITRLVKLEEQEEPQNRRGYINTASGYFKKGSFVKSAFGLIGIEVGENFAKKATLAGDQALKLIGLQGLDEVDLEMVRKSVPYYDFTKLNLPQLFELAASLKKVAY